MDDVLYVIGGYVYPECGGNSWTLVASNEAYVPFGFRSVPVDGVVSPLSEVVYNVSDVCLEFVVDRPVSLLYYCVDGGANVTVVGNNVFLSGLFGGVHSVVVFAEDEYGNIGASETITFTVANAPLSMFFITFVVAIVAVAVVVWWRFVVVFAETQKH